MSSILKALKKLESDSSHQDIFIPWPRNIQRKRNGITDTGRTGRTAKKIILIAALLVIVASGAMWFGRKQVSIKGLDSGTISSSVKEETKKPAAELKTPYHPAPSALEKKPLPVSKQESTLVEKPKPRPKKPTVGAPRHQKRVTPTTSPVKPYQEKKFESFNKAQSPLIEKETKPPTPMLKSDKEEKSAVIPKKQSSPIEQMDGNRLKLDAIAWSDDPKKRIAVINGRIVREGESVEGYVIIRIDVEEVIVREGGKSWRLVFRIH